MKPRIYESEVKGLTLAKGAAYTISVPEGILTDFAGNKVAAFRLLFGHLKNVSNDQSAFGSPINVLGHP